MSELPVITYPDLPVSAVRDEIAAAIRDHQVVIVAGETGSGKTTQLPKICLELGRTMIGHTQPRRIAARAVAERIATELGTELGGLVGYQVRFTDKTSKASRIKLMTDGILLAELQRDRDLRRYDTIIIDEAHERSLNIDFLLGYLRQLLPRRPDLKIIITSATIDPARFAEHFADVRTGEPAPIIEVSGRTFPVEVRYRPLVELPESGPAVDGEGEVVVKDQTEAIVDAVKELSAAGPGDILVFLPGEREIRDTADALTSALRIDASKGTLEVVPLFSRLSAADQHKVFSSHTGRRIVLSTNVAETSLTVPGIRYVIDTGVARISRYSARTKVQRLPIEPISQASANQRSGRCGRVAEGIAIRLYSEEEFDARPEFTDPEILRTNLASVILQMASLRLGDIADFPFVESPEKRNISSGVQLLEELGALVPAVGDQPGQAPQLTELGRRLARLPIDPRLGRMVLEADKRGCLREVMVIAAAMSLQDPRERPGADDPQGQARAAQSHARFKHEASDFLAWLNLWTYLKTQQRELSSSAFRRMCRAEHLHYLRVREWQEFESQLRQVAKEMGLRGELADTPDEDGIHQSLLAGLLSQIGALDVREDKAEPGRPREKGKRPGPREYLGSRTTRFAIFPGSNLARKNPPFVMAGELVETSRLWARQVASIKPEWAEELAPTLVKRTYSEPHWSRKRAAVMAHEKVTLYGVPLVADRLTNYGRVDKPVARELFIRHALVQGEWNGRHAFLKKNAALLDDARALEHKARRRDIVVDEETLFDFYDARVGANVVSGAHFDSWWKKQKDKELLTFDPSLLARDVDVSDFPSAWESEALTFNLSYHFEPGATDDGMTIDIPVATLNRVDDGDFSWNVPGHREEIVTTLIRGLPKNLRVHLVPAPDRAREFLAAVSPGEEPLLTALERWIRSAVGVVVPREAWAPLPEHLRPTYRVIDDRGREQARGKDLEALKKPLAGEFRRAIDEVATDAGLTATGATSWTFGTIAETVTEKRAGHEVTVYRCLADEGSSVGLMVVGGADEAVARHRLGVARLLLLDSGAELVKRIGDGLSMTDKLALAATPYPSAADLIEDCRAAVARATIDAHPLPRDPEAYAVIRAAYVDDLEARVRATLGDALRALAAQRKAEKALTGRVDMYQLPAVSDMKDQLGRLFSRGFISQSGPHLRRYPTYVAALLKRRERIADASGLRADQSLMIQMADLQARYLQAMAALPAGRPAGPRLREVRWLLEEWRVSLWAQNLGTAVPVSDARIRKILDS